MPELPESIDKSPDGHAASERSIPRQLFEAVVSTLQEPLIILRSDLTVESANPAFYQHFKVDADHTIDCPLYQLGNGQWDIPDLRKLLAKVLQEESLVTGYRVDHEFQQIGRRVLLLNAHRLDNADNAPSIVLTFRDNTEVEFAKEYAEKVIDALRDPFLILDWDLRVRSANHPFYQTFGVSPNETEGQFIYDLGNQQWDIPRLRELLEDILPNSSTFDDFEVEHDFENVGHRVMCLNARRVDHLKLILLVIEDVTDARRADTRQKVLLGELQHRVKNLMMNVRALSQLTAQGSSTLETFTKVFDDRLDAMARTQDLLVRGAGDTASLAEILHLELQAIGGREGSTFSCEGPEVQLSSRAAHAFAMTIHELATNAAKYGALSKRASNGFIVISWSAGRVEDDENRLHFKWKEQGLTEPPVRESVGFGTQVVENSLPYLFGGSSTLSFQPDGVECVIDCRIPVKEPDVPRAEQP
jgi:two-component sensor histidine kinase/PAS domain-containing protein